jgi:hypothetical protein
VVKLDVILVILGDAVGGGGKPVWASVDCKLSVVTKNDSAAVSDTRNNTYAIFNKSIM